MTLELIKVETGGVKWKEVEFNSICLEVSITCLLRGSFLSERMTHDASQLESALTRTAQSLHSSWQRMLKAFHLFIDNPTIVHGRTFVFWHFSTTDRN